MFILKKLMGSLLKPLPLSLLLLGLGVVLYWAVTRHFKKQAGILGRRGLPVARALIIAGFTVLLVSSNGPFSRWLVAPLEELHPMYKGQPVSAVLVLGSYHHSAPDIPVTSYLEHDSLYRLAEGIRIALLHESIPLIVSGYAFRDSMSQAEAYRQVAVALGFPAERIKLVESGRDTFEEMQAVASIVGQQPFALVTSAYHMPRSMAAARQQALQPVAAPTWHKVKPVRGEGINFWLLMPSVSALKMTTRAVHEYLGMAWYKLSGRI